jgi:hypothetical protein
LAANNAISASIRSGEKRAKEPAWGQCCPSMWAPLSTEAPEDSCYLHEALGGDPKGQHLRMPHSSAISFKI